MKEKPVKYGVQYLETWADYPDSWGDVERDDQLLVFDSVKEAEDWIEKENKKQEERLAKFLQEAEEYNKPREELYHRRVEALKNAGLWENELDGRLSPLVSPGGKGPFGRPQVETYKVVLETELWGYDEE